MYYLLMLGAILISLFAQIRVQSAFKKWKNIRNNDGLTGAAAARRILDANGLYHVQIQCIPGNLTDHYDPRTNIISLSTDVYSGDSVAAVGIAAHEVGHAIQHNNGYAPIKIRSALVPVVNFGGNISWWLVMGGVMLSAYLSSSAGGGNLGYTIAMIGVILYASVTAFHLITLPVELNASNRAKRSLDQIMTVESEERRGVRKVLGAAALTYVAALLTSAINLLRLISIVSGSRRD